MDSANTRLELDEAASAFPEPVPTLEPVPGNLPATGLIPPDPTIPIVSGMEPQPPNHGSITRLAYEIWSSGGQKADTDKANWRSAEITLWTTYVHQMDECHDSPGRVSFGKITA